MTYKVRQSGVRALSAFLGALVLALWPGFAIAQDQEVAIAVPHLSAGEEDVSPAQRPLPNKKALKTRFVIGVDREVDARVFALRKPNRVIIDLPDINMRLPEGEPVGLVKRFRGGLSAPGRARVVIDVTQPVIVEKRELTQHSEGGYRLAIEFAPVSDAIGGDQDTKKITANGSSPQIAHLVQPPLPQPALRPQERAKRSFKPLIVIDPGHGGYDTGAKKNGIVEKQVVLAFSLELRKQLEATGRYRIKMTRDTDVFIPLDDRVAFGERHGANLFIAVHADYAGSRARGATIYSLRDRVARRLKRSALGSINHNVLSMTERSAVNANNSADARVVQDILSDLAARDVATTQARTGMFAQTVIENMGESTRMRPKPDQQAAFRVLKTAQFPSVLIELAFVTNRIDARNLKSDEWRSRVAESIATAVDSYFAAQEIRLPL